MLSNINPVLLDMLNANRNNTLADSGLGESGPTPVPTLKERFVKAVSAYVKTSLLEVMPEACGARPAVDKSEDLGERLLKGSTDVMADSGL
jgi:hypothetical protein